MRNIPCEYTREELLELIDEHGYQGSYAFVYLPFDLKSQSNLGKAFIHFTTSSSYESFLDHFNGFSDWKVQSDKICEVSCSESFNTLEDRIENYRNTHIMNEPADERFK